jgi:hypothetical protein
MTLLAPGLWLQRLTTREPTLDQLEVSIRALREVLALEARQDRGDAERVEIMAEGADSAAPTQEVVRAFARAAVSGADPAAPTQEVVQAFARAAVSAAALSHGDYPCPHGGLRRSDRRPRTLLP